MSSKEARVTGQHLAPVSDRFASRFLSQASSSPTTSETRAAEIRAAYERGELRSNETPEQAATRNAVYLALHQPPSRGTARRPVGARLGHETEVLHRKRFIEKKNWKQCFSEYYSEGGRKPPKPKVKEVERVKRNNVKACERRLQKKRKNRGFN